MDVNTALAEIRTLITRWQAAGSRNDGPDPWTEADADRLAEATADLDRWLSGGGALPYAWDRGPHRDRTRIAHIPPRRFG